MSRKGTRQAHTWDGNRPHQNGSIRARSTQMYVTASRRTHQALETHEGQDYRRLKELQIDRISRQKQTVLFPFRNEIGGIRNTFFYRTSIGI